MRKIMIYGLSSSRVKGFIRYVGQTVLTLDHRLTCHVTGGRKRYTNTYKDNWIHKELKEGFSINIHLLDSTLNGDADDLERYYIRKYRDKIGFRLTNYQNGGLRGNNSHNSKSLLQYDLSGNFIKEYLNSMEAGECLDTVPKNIRKCCTGKRKSAGGFIWKYRSGKIEKNIPSVKRNFDYNKKPVSKYSISDDFITSYDSIREAEKYVTVTASDISMCLNGHMKTAGGFKWEFRLKHQIP